MVAVVLSKGSKDQASITLTGGNHDFMLQTLDPKELQVVLQYFTPLRLG